MSTNIIYKAAAYARASKDDTDSDTIENQIELIRNHVKSMPEIDIVSVREDSGFSGINFIRPSFIEMMKDIDAGNINCVIVKDLSRLGRNYIEVGELLDVVFPEQNIRVIAVNDNYDSLNPRSDADYILLPFKNIINEQYLRDFSIKVRSSMDMKRKKGQFVANFAPYGYKRDPDDKHKIIIDDHAAQVVRQIFQLRIEGISTAKIAKRLNDIGEPSPAEYKKRETNYVSAFQKNDRARWDSRSICRILKNPIYTGVLIQGKVTSPNYKVKNRVIKPENEWHVIPDNHEPIINKRDFETVAILLKQDTHVSLKNDMLYPLSGYLYCGDCGNSMVRSRTGKYIYYVCASSMKKGICSSHGVRDHVIEDLVKDAISNQVALVLEINEAFELAKQNLHRLKGGIKLSEQITDREKEIKFCEKNKSSLHDDYIKGIISKEDVINFTKNYTLRIKDLKQAVSNLRKEAELLLDSDSRKDPWIEHIKQYKNLPELNRQAVVSLIERIEVFTGKRIEIKFRYQDKLQIMENVLKNLPEDERGVDNGGKE